MIFNFTLLNFSFLFLFLLSQGVSSFTSLTPSENNNLLKKRISQPHSIIFSNVMENIEASFQDMKSYVTTQLTQQKIEYKDQDIIFESDDLSALNLSSIIDDKDIDSERRLDQTSIIPSKVPILTKGTATVPNTLDTILAATQVTAAATTPITKVSTLKNGACLNNGKEITLKVNIYSCKGVQVSKEQYEILKKSQSCAVVKNSNQKVCYCSFEYYGNKCESINTYTCELDFLGPMDQCKGKDSFDYVYSYSGTPPCNFVENGQIFSIK